MSEQVLLMVGSYRRDADGIVVGSDVLPRRCFGVKVLQKQSNALSVNIAYNWCCLRPQSDRGKKQVHGLFTQTRDHTQTLEKSGRRGVSSVVARRANFASHVLPLSIGVDWLV
jgi:hypothetical protein